jgi:hypothetical protein
MRRELGQLSLADGVVEGGAGRNRHTPLCIPSTRSYAAKEQTPA